MTSQPRIHRINGYITQLFLLEGDDGLVLLDCGCRGDSARVERFIVGDLDRPARDLRLAVATHAHPDHAGGACRLRRSLGVAIAAPRGIDRWYAGLGGTLQHIVDRRLTQLVARRSGRRRESVAFPRRVRADIELRDGDEVPHAHGWHVVRVPGHTSHDIILHHREGGTVYVADLVVRVGSGFRLPVPVLFPDLMAASLERLAGLGADRLLLAHGGEVSKVRLPDLIDRLQGQVSQPSPPAMQRLKWLTAFPGEVRRVRRMLRSGRAGGEYGP
jgi:glyoxylase-like metal-dependent hydrolase (beta-lactamase superfamily II)